MAAAPGIEPHLGYEIASRLNAAVNGDKGWIVADYCAVFGWSPQKLYRVAAAFGYRSGRKPRHDKGVSGKLSDPQVKKIAAVIEGTRRRTGKVNMASWNALGHCADNGVISPEAVPHPSTLNRRLREMRLSRSDLARPEPAVEMQSLHPNYVHQIDASVCVMWDFAGKKRLITRDMQTAFYKNKPGFWRDVKKVILRYICVDHATGWLFPYYYYSRGEDFKNLFDFTVRAWGVKENPAIFPAHGVPRILMIDKGAANISQYYTNFLENLQVAVSIHTPGKPWINGVVEAAHAFWERSFEGDLSLLKIESLEELNARAFDKAAYLNATRTHKRTCMSRFEGFARITREQLFILPPREVCQRYCHTNAERATVNGLNQLRYDGRRYALAATFRRGDKLYVRWNPKEWPAIDVNTREDFAGEAIASTLINETEWGYSASAPVIGEQFRAHKQDATTAFKKRLPGIDISDVVPRLQAPKLAGLTWMPKKGTEMTPAPVAIPPMTAHEARKRLREDLGIERLTPLQSEWLDGRLAGSPESGSQESGVRSQESGVTEEQYGALRDEYRQRFIGTPAEATPRRRLHSI